MIDTKSTKRLLVCAMVVALAATTMAAGAHATTADGTPHGELTTTNAGDRLTLEVTDSSDDTVTVTVSSTVADTAGFQANLSYAPSDADVESVEFEELGGVNQYTHDSDTGHVFLTQSTVGSESVDEPTLATVTFTVDEELAELEFVDDDSLVTDGDGDVVGESDESSESGSSPDGSGSGGVDDESDGEANATGADENDGDEADDENGTDGNGDGETDTADETGSSDDSDGGETETDDETNSSDDSSDDNEVNSSDDSSDDNEVNSSDDETDGDNDDDDSDGLPGFGAAITTVALLAVLGTCLRSRRD